MVAMVMMMIRLKNIPKGKTAKEEREHHRHRHFVLDYNNNTMMMMSDDYVDGHDGYDKEFFLMKKAKLQSDMFSQDTIMNFVTE